MVKNIKIVLSPFNPNLEIFGDIVINVQPPYSESDVNLQINPNIQDYVENNDQPNVDVRQIMVSTITDDTRKLHLDFKKDNIQGFEINKQKYTIKLLNIGKDNIEGQDFPTFEFIIES